MTEGFYDSIPYLFTCISKFWNLKSIQICLENKFSYFNCAYQYELKAEKLMLKEAF